MLSCLGRLPDKRERERGHLLAKEMGTHVVSEQASRASPKEEDRSHESLCLAPVHERVLSERETSGKTLLVTFRPSLRPTVPTLALLRRQPLTPETGRCRGTDLTFSGGGCPPGPRDTGAPPPPSGREPRANAARRGPSWKLWKGVGLRSSAFEALFSLEVRRRV